MYCVHLLDQQLSLHVTNNNTPHSLHLVLFSHLLFEDILSHLLFHLLFEKSHLIFFHHLFSRHLVSSFFIFFSSSFLQAHEAQNLCENLVLHYKELLRPINEAEKEEVMDVPPVISNAEVHTTGEMNKVEGYHIRGGGGGGGVLREGCSRWARRREHRREHRARVQSPSNSHPDSPMGGSGGGQRSPLPFSFLSSIDNNILAKLSQIKIQFKKFLYGGVSMQWLVPNAKPGSGGWMRREQRTLWLMLPEVGALRLEFLSKFE